MTGAAAAADAPRERRVVVHIGTMKTGTSYLQQVLTRNDAALRSDGILYASELPIASRAMREVLNNPDARFTGAWPEFVAEIEAWRGGIVLVSEEMLSFLPDQPASELVSSVRGNGAKVQIVITARDLARTVPSAWQNKIKHGQEWPFEDYVAAVINRSEDPPGAARSFWHHHDLPVIVRRWVAAAGVDNVVVIPIPPADAPPITLWQRFATTIGIDADRYAADQDQRSNLSMGYAETEMLREVNLALRDLLDRETQKRFVLRFLANDVLRPDPRDGERPRGATLSNEAYDWAVTCSREFAEDVANQGVHIVEPIGDLVPRARSAEEAAAAPPPLVPPGVTRAIVQLIVRIAQFEGGAIDPAQSRGGMRNTGVGRVRKGPKRDGPRGPAVRGKRSREWP